MKRIVCIFAICLFVSIIFFCRNYFGYSKTITLNDYKGKTQLQIKSTDSIKNYSSLINNIEIMLSEKYPNISFAGLFKLINMDSVNSEFKFSTAGDTIYFVYKKYIEGGMIYRLWNTSDSIYDAFPFREEPLLIKKEIIEWDTCKLSNRKRDECIVGGEHYMISSRIIIKDGSYTIESVEHEDYRR